MLNVECSSSSSLAAAERSKDGASKRFFKTLTPQLSTKDLVRGRLMIGLAGAVKLKQLLVFLGYFFNPALVASCSAFSAVVTASGKRPASA